MSRRSVVLMLAAAIAAAVAIPALADTATTAKSSSVKGLTKRALGKAKDSLRLARGAKRVAGKAAGVAAAAQTAATAAQSSAGAADGAAANAVKAAASASEKAGGAELNSKEAKESFASIRSRSGFAEGAETFTSEEFKKSPQGPTVSVVVPPGSGLVQVWAQATISEEGAISLYEDGEQVEGQAECAGTATGGSGLFAGPVGPAPPTAVSTPASGGFCGTPGPPAPVLFETTAGPHTFELRYAACGCAESKPPLKATFSDRRLVVAPLP